MATAEATLKTPTLSLVLSAAVLGAAAYFAELPGWLLLVPLSLVLAEGAIMLRYAIAVAQTASQAIEEQRRRLALDDDVRQALARAAEREGQP